MRTTTLLVVLLAGSIEASIRVPGGGPYRSPHTGSSICGSRAVFKLPGNCASNVCTPPSSGNCDHLTVKRERTLRPIGNSPCDKSTCYTEANIHLGLQKSSILISLETVVMLCALRGT
ncbi:uncharacterized protein RAG0_04703 [Rhynchosporium agropyri]|uniref:Secreted protein n=1 Tax=Rhynchosporium agropyri TaxID=914238 RepID=A0A1E1KA37_9HELO|nr:uncharacterized protein RAG0_04703 [Rhynchosporium agropyri]